MALWAGGLLLLVAGCGDSGVGTCRDDTDCGGSACIDGRCHMVEGDAAMMTQAGDLSSASNNGGDGAPRSTDLGAGPGIDGIAPSCQFNGDGVITREEAPFMVGLGGLFVVNASGMDDTVVVQPQNGVWDFTAPVTGDYKAFDQLLTPAGAWWASSFPMATYAERIDANQAIDGVYEVTNDSLLLLGVVSEASGVTQTLLTYATPIKVLQFPLQVGSTWTSTSTLSGTNEGDAFYYATDKYTFTVDLRGTTKVPAGPFDTLRLKVTYSDTVGFLVTTHFQYIHLAECYGAVARLTSQNDEQSADFTSAEEYRRMSTP